MTHNWFIVRGSNEQGPFSAQRLKQLADTGQVRPRDLLRRDDKKTSKPASSVKGLFDVMEAQPAQPVQNSVKSPLDLLRDHWKLVTTLGVGLMICFVALLVVLGKVHTATKQEVVEADRLWDTGKKAEALTMYRALLANQLKTAYLKEERPRVYGRVIDAEFEGGHADSGKRLIDEAVKKGVTPSVSHSDAKVLVAAREAEKARAEAEKQDRAASGATGGGGSAEYRKGYEEGLAFGQKWGHTVYAQGALVTREEFKDVVSAVQQHDCPYPDGSNKAKDWKKGFEDGTRKGLGKNLSRD